MASNANQRTQMIRDIFVQMDKLIGYIDYDLEEMREQQLCVDLAIEKYYKKIEFYPKTLKRLFDMGTHLLNMFDTFFVSWYSFQIELQKFYNFIFTSNQELIIDQLQSNFQLHQLEKIVMHYHVLQEEFCKIKSYFEYFNAEIASLNLVLFKNTNQVTTDCLKLFEKIGVMDFQGVGSLIRNNHESKNGTL